MKKVDAAAETLSHINPDVEIEAFHMNVTTIDGYEAFLASLGSRNSEVDDCGDTRELKQVDLVLSCVDNYEARIVVNRACLELNQTWIESGVSEDAVSGHIQVIKPGELACFECAPPLVM